MIVGIDEVGRGPWAGPLVVGAVVLAGATIDGLTDSKKLSKRRREALAAEILASNASVGLGWVHAAELDKLGLSRSLVEATKRALTQIRVPYHEIIIDGTVNFLADTDKGAYVTTMKKADLLIPSVSAASIVAKVARDEFMASQDELYPEYGFASHVGYGTAAHRQALETYGATPLHRLSFGPLASLEPDTTKKPAVSTRSIGNRGEDIASLWLEEQGYALVARNWKTKLCEIDIVASREGTLYFIEVKHRKSGGQGGGIAAVTSKKQRRMKFAATVYAQFEQYGGDARLGVITTTGEPASFESFLLLE